MNKKLYEMNNLYNSPRIVLTIAIIFAMGFCNVAISQVPTLTVRFANPIYQCSNDQYCLDIEFQSDTPDQELFGMNVRFFYDDADMDIISFSDFQGGYGPSAGNPGPVVMSAPGFGTNFFNFPAPGVADFINFGFQKIDGNAPPIILGTTDWTKLLQVCFTVQGPVSDSANFCPPIVWDLRVDPADGGYLAGDDGVVMTVVAPPPTMSSPADENVVQFNWAYSGNGIDPPFGDPVPNECIDLFCIPTIACPADITIECIDSTDPMETGFATASDACMSAITVTYSDVVNGSGCLMTYTIERTWTAINECGEASIPCTQIITVNQLPTLIVRFNNPDYSCLTGQYCLDVELQADMPNIELFGMNVRFFYDDSYMELIGFSDFQGGYGPVAPNPPSVQTSMPGFGTNYFNYPAPGIVDFVNGGVQLVDDMAPPIYISTNGWTKIFQVCFQLEESVQDTTSFCPPIVWDLEVDPANGGYLPGDDGVVITIVNPPPAMSGPATENVQQFNWMYSGNGIDPPFGEPVDEVCLNLVCLPDIVCPADITLECTDSTDPANTGFASATDACMLDITISYSDETTDGGSGCINTYIINRTWVAVNECDFTDVCVQVITVIDTSAPLLVCPPFITISCDDSTDPAFTGMASATDNCDPAPVVTYIDIPKAGPCPQSYTIDRIWSGTDECGNTIFCRQEITLIDSAPPVITCPVDLTLECDEVVPTDFATATDNCSPTGNITLEYNDIVCDNPIMGFNEGYDFANWTIINPDGGSVTPMGDMQVMIESVDTGVPCPDGASVLFQIVVPSTGQIVFDWDFTSMDVNGPLYDPFGYNLNGTFYQLTDDNGPDHQHGTASVAVTAGDIFAFEQNSIDCILGIGATTVVEFFACVEQMEETCSQLIIRQHTATDECGNSANCIQTIYIIDTTNPLITCPADLVIECDESTLPANTGMASATDNCDTTPDISYTDVTIASQTCVQEYTINRTWTATDACGNLTSCLQVITIDDSTPPVIVCPADLTLECTESTDPADTGLATATDNCDNGPLVITSSDAITPGACPQEYIIVRTFFVSDACGNSSTCAQTITVEDTTPPVITCPVSLTIECDESTSPDNTGLASATDNCDTAPIVTYSDAIVGGACPQEFTITRTWTATDACGNFSTCDQVIEVDDSMAPVIIFCPSDITIECDESTSPDNTGLVTATDNCDTAPTITYTETITPGACPQEYSIVRVWNITDACGNGTACTQLITVDDSTPPVITCPADLTLECTDPIPTDLATATDNCSSTITVTYSDIMCDNPVQGFTGPYDIGLWTTIIPSEGGDVVVMGDNEVMLTSADITICNDASVQFSINVTSTGQIVFDWSYETMDVDGPFFDPFGYNLNGTFYQLTNDNGNDIQSGTATVAVTAGDVFAFDQMSTDCQFGAGATTVVEFFACIEQDAEICTQLIIRTHTAIDECSNESSCVQTIFIEDTTPPLLTCAADVTIECTESTDPANTGMASATDFCDPTPDIAYVDVTIAGECPQEYTIERTWTATDNCGNATICLQVIIVDDSTPPVVECPPNLTLECDESTAPLNTGFASATDNCNPGPLLGFSSDSIVPGACPQEYTILRTFSFGDGCGNFSSCVQTILVEDTTPPSLVCPASLTIECDESTDPMNTGLATATDNCDTAPIVSYTDVTVAGNCPQEYTITRTWTATDACGNGTNCIQVITIDDSTAPVFTSCPADVTIQCDESTDPADTGIASATDNCDAAPVVTYTDVITPGACPQEYTITRTWTAIDECGNETLCGFVDRLLTSEADFSGGETHLDFDGLSVGVFNGDEYAAEGVSFACNVNMGIDASFVHSPPYGLGNFYPAAPCAPIEVTFDSKMNRVGFWVATNSPDDLNIVVTCLINGVEIADETFVTNETSSFHGLESATGFDQLIFTAVGSSNSCFVLDDLRFEGGCCVQTIKVIDTIPPTITFCPTDVTIECDESTLPDNTGLATATDNCAAEPVVTYNDVITQGQCLFEMTISRTWSATDECGNESTCLQTIVVEDTTPPVLVCAADLAIECDESTDPINTGEASATDNCSAEPIVIYNDVTVAGECPQEYTITRTWTATDDCGNSTTCVQSIIVEDTTPPVVSCPADITIDCNDSTDPENTGVASATDNCDMQLPGVEYADVTIADGCPEVIERTWSSIDACGNVGSCVQIITIDDTTPPMIICPGDVTVECASDVPQVLTGGVTVSDNCGFVTVTHDGDFVSDSTCLNQYTISRVYRATDECGNTATCTQTIEVDDQTPPVIACPADITVDCAEDVPAPDTGSASATDNCEGDVVITHISDVTISQTCENQFVMIRTYAATDACGNSSICQQTITVFDDIAPTIACPASVTVECAEDVPPVDTGAPVASDNCSTGPVTVGWLGDVISNQTCVNRFTLTRTYQATDACGNTATCVQIIIVDDQTAPTIVCPPNITVTFGDSESPDNTGLPTGTDNCGTAPPTFTFEDEIIPGPCDEEYTIIRTWTSTDACGNFTTCVQEIFVDGDCIVDLALTKVLLSDFEVDGGDNLLFQITVLNEGEVTISSLAITDYIPLGFSLNDPNWTPGMAGSSGQSASIVLSIANGGLDANGLNPGEFVNVTINLLADIDIAPGYYYNCAEILNMFDLQGNNISDEDIDSTPDNIDTNDPPGEDDFDCAPICVLPEVIISGDGYVCPLELVNYSVNDYNPNFTYDWSLSGGGVIVADNGSDIDIQWQEEPGGPFQITLTVTLGDGCSISAIYFVYIQGVETIACNDHIQISLGDSCETVLLSGIILEGENEGNNNYFVVITDADGNVIPDATLTSEHIGGTFTVTVMNECNGQSCWGTVTVEDKIAPVIICTDVTVSCGTSLAPVYEPPVTGSVSETITPALPIGPNGGTVTTAELILDVPSNAVVTDVNVTVDLNHTWVGDIDVVLVSPSGTQVVLADQICGSVDNWDNVIFDDEAGISVTASCNPIPPALAGSVIPQGVLASIDGQTAVGTWKLVITDNANGDAGTLNLVTLDVDYYLAVPSAPYAYDACGEVNLTYTEIESGDACDQLTLTRYWTATDGSGNTNTCVQTITITPLTLDNVEFPDAYVGVCGESILPNNTGWPTVDGTPITDESDLCNIFVGYWDKELFECGGGRKIARTWTVLDWCAVELVEAVQVIKLTDNVGPELTCPDNMTVGTDFWYCYANVSVPKPEAIDECSEIASYSLTASSGTVISFGNNFVINGLEIGTHTATWTVSDECGNSTTCSFQITVVDDVVPVANCDSHTTISLTNDGPGGVTLVPATVFDDGSYDNCGPVTFRARRMDSCIDFDWTTEGACIDDTPGGIPPVNSRDRGTVHRPCVPFACCDVGAGPIMVELEVTDAAGNVNYCMVEATVQDKISPFVECPPNDIIVSCDFWFNVQEGTFVDGEGNNDGSLDEDPLSAVFGNMYDAFRYDESVRQNVIINDPGNTEVGQPHNWGLDGWADDNCEVNLSVRVRVVDDCSGGDLPGSAPDGAIKYIERRFSASDGNVGVAPGTCTQRIWVVDFEPFYIADVNCNNQDPRDGVIWPCDVLLTTCPEDLGNTGEPIIFDDACSLIGMTYEDERFDFVDGACFKILRRWSVIDWCQYDSQTGEGLWNYTQVIKVHDEDGPEFVEDCETVVLCVEDEGVSLPDNNQAFLGEDDPLSSSCSVHLNLSRVVHETCSDVVQYDVKIYPFNGTEFILIQPTRSAAVDSNNNATLSFDTRQSTIQDIRKNGLPYNSQFCGDYHRILWSVEDGCGNWSHCEYLFRLEDCKKPSPVCINGLSTVVMPIGGEVTVWAKDFNASSFDDCTPSEELLYSFSEDAYEPSYTYTCDNVPAFNVEIPVQIWVADGGTDDNCNGLISWTERNKDYCSTTIVITDNNNVCDGEGSILAGEIFTEFEDAVAQVGVRLTSPGQFFPMYVTAENGKYEFIGIPFGDDYEITPERDDSHRNGVSTLDLVRIQKHLLGKEPFTSPYQYIAADANNSESISAIDLVEIRKLILGLYTEFPANQSWRFVEKGFDMDNENPWPFSEIIQLPGLTEDSLMHNDFVGVKIGDVNNTAKANALQILPRSGRRVLHVELDAAKTVEAGDVIDVKLIIPESVEGFQWTLETEGLTYAGVNSESIRMNDSHVGVLNDGIITMSWNEEGEHAEGVTQTVELQFVANTSGNVGSMIRLTGAVTEAEAYTAAGEILDVKLSQSGDVAEFALYQNTPNPWNDQTTIGFDIPEDASVTFTVFDATGKIVKTVEGDYAAGYNTIIISAKDLPASGVMYYRLESGAYSASKKMVLVK